MSVALGAFAQGAASGWVGQKKEKERLAENQRRDDFANKQIDSMDRYSAAMSQMAQSGGGFGASMPSMGTAGGDTLSYGGGAAPAGNTPTTAVSTGASGFAGLLAKHEGAGNYDTLFGHSQKSGPFAGVRVSQMTIGEASEFASPSGKYGQWVKGKVGRVATPMGAGQIVGTTLRNTAKAMGLPPDTPFNADTQNKMINYLANQRISGASTPEGRRAALRAEWEGFKNVPDSQLDAAISSHLQKPTMGARPQFLRGV